MKKFEDRDEYIPEIGDIIRNPQSGNTYLVLEITNDAMNGIYAKNLETGYNVKLNTLDVSLVFDMIG
jgi:hypothetical protein